MAVGEDFLEFVSDLFAALGPLKTRRMFGGVGFYRQGLFFAIADDDRLFLKVDDQTEHAFREAGAEPFAYGPRYWSLPEAALDDPDEAVLWARLALDAAARAAK